MASALMSILVTAPLAVSAAAQTEGSPIEALLDLSWKSQHWAVVEVHQEEPQYAIVVDRASIVVGANSNEREVNYLLFEARKPPRSGAVARIRLDCSTMALRSMSGVEYRDGKRQGAAQSPEDRPVTVTPDKHAFANMKAVCTGNWGEVLVVDGPIEAVHAMVFPN